MRRKVISPLSAASCSTDTGGNVSSCKLPPINVAVKEERQPHWGSHHMSRCTSGDGVQSECKITRPKDEAKETETKGLVPRRGRRHADLNQGLHEQKNAAQLCKRWISLYRKEQMAASVFVDIARDLFYDVVVRNNSFIVSNGHEQLAALAARTAVSCFLLEEVANSLSRYEVLSPYVGMLLRLIYVPNTAEERDALGGSVVYTRLQRELKELPQDSAAQVLLHRYARKPYFVAHHELSQKVILYAHSNLAQQERFRRLPRIFDLLSSNWIKSFLRTTLKAWRTVCLKREQNERKHRARWARRFATERIRSVVRVWRVHAQVRLQNAATAESMKSRIRLVTTNMRNLQKEISVLMDESAALSAELERKEETLTSLDKRIAEVEREYKQKMQYVCEIDRIGSKLISSMMRDSQFPEGTESMLPIEVLVLWANTTLVESHIGRLFVATTESLFLELVDSFELGESSKITANKFSQEELPFSSLLAETATVFVPMHYMAGLIHAVDTVAGPTVAEIKGICGLDASVRELRRKMEEDLEAVEESQLASVMKLEKEVGSFVINSYQTVTGSVPLVTAEQLMTRQRGFQLVFLAGLMRYFTNWVDVSLKAQRGVHGSDTNSETQPSCVVDGEHETMDGEAANSVAITSRSASMRSPLPLPPVVAQEHSSGRMRRNTDWMHPPNSHLNWIPMAINQQRWINASFNALHTAVNVALEQPGVCTVKVQEEMPMFMENVTMMRLSDILSRDAAAEGSFFFLLARSVETALPKLRDLFLLYATKATDLNVGGSDESSSKPRKSRTKSMASGGEMLKIIKNSSSDTANSYVYAMDFWRMLRDCRVVGGRGKLHRAAVHRIIEKVAENSSTSLKVSVRGGEMNQSINASRRPRQTRDVPEIDLKPTHYKLRLGPAEFVEALLRCALVWDYMQKLLQDDQRVTRKMDVSQVKSSPETPGSSSFEALVSPYSRLDASERQQHGAVNYTMYDPTWKLRPAAVNEFFNEYIIFCGFRGPTLDAFNRAKRHPQLRTQFVAQQDALFALFSQRAKPKEGFGMRVGAVDAVQGEAHPTPKPAFASVTPASTHTTDSNDVGIVRVLTLSGFQGMAVDFGWYRIRRVTAQVIEDAFLAVVADADHEPRVVFYPEWLDLLCVLAHYFQPNPTVPLYEKVRGFLELYVLNHYREEY
ncbi:hypothetical protein ERJ75_001226200 [Trypanosoma vivax]|uniref:NET2A-D/KIP1-like C-terminal domain-containing protein n=1 Tax=Trypanosoma vivax (strain Y486) TaxID=1055687 RepID=G0U1B1_TRYVY|nr:hypothetical protein TRVL_01586 [Trypanosoma vivax]KAH8609066.1 hypothetical protein ERJ75_001226200 [Trypanosoma vivax]CCC49866.1 conserved hypothetical protein [Trypanosoma vivax Y486]